MNHLSNVSRRDLTRNSMLWFSVAFMLTIIPQLFLFLPIWVAGLFFICFIWRVQIFRMKLGYPNGVVKFTAIAAIIGILYLTKGNFLNAEGCSILFMAIYALKFIEAKTVRDGYVLGCIGLIALASIYLFDNTAYIFVYSLLIFITLLAALIGLQQVDYGINPSRLLLVNALKIIGISLPLMVVLFVIFPRFPSMLPNINKGPKEQVAQTGVSNRMEPGSIAELANSDTHILWAEFTQAVPETKNLYWRSLTLDRFDGRAWDQDHMNQISVQPNYQIINRNNEQMYSVIFDPSQQKYLATLDLSRVDRESLARPDAVMEYSDFRFEYAQPIENKIQYKMLYTPNVRLLKNNDQRLSDSEKRFLQITNNNPETTKLVDTLMSKQPTKEEFVEEILTHFKTQGFKYTLEPGLLEGRNSIDDFMFDSKLGFCEHYASATAFMLRKANIPSRIVIGYLGGAVDNNRQLVEVRGKDAHAWVEYWNDEAWVRIDPTIAVAPNRVDMGMDELINSLTGNPRASTWDELKIALVNFKDIVDFRWTKMILGYQNQTQQSLLKKLFNMDFMSVFTLIKLSIGLLFTFVMIQVIVFLKPWQRLFFNIRNEYLKVIQLANKVYGLNLPISTAPLELSVQLKKYLPLNEQEAVQVMSNEMVAYFYQSTTDQTNLSSVKRSLLAVQKILKEKNVRK